MKFVKKLNIVMENSKIIEIQLSKTKLILSFLGAIVFVGLGIWLITTEPPESLRISIFSIINFTITNTKLFFICIGLLSILFFGSCAFFILKKLRDNSPGLIITEEGVTYSPSATSVDFIPWEDVIAIEEIKISHQKFINLVLKDPQAYIDKQKSAFKRKTMKMNYNMCGTLVSISAISLKCSYKELKAMLEQKFVEFNKKNS